MKSVKILCCFLMVGFVGLVAMQNSNDQREIKKKQLTEELVEFQESLVSRLGNLLVPHAGVLGASIIGFMVLPKDLILTAYLMVCLSVGAYKGFKKRNLELELEALYRETSDLRGEPGQIERIAKCFARIVGPQSVWEGLLRTLLFWVGGHLRMSNLSWEYPFFIPIRLSIEESNRYYSNWHNVFWDTVTTFLLTGVTTYLSDSNTQKREQLTFEEYTMGENKKNTGFVNKALRVVIPNSYWEWLLTVGTGFVYWSINVAIHQNNRPSERSFVGMVKPFVYTRLFAFGIKTVGWFIHKYWSNNEPDRTATEEN